MKSEPTLSAMRKVARESLGEQAEAALKKEAMHREFIANVSHQFRTPLAAIIGAAQTLDKVGLGAGERRRFVEIIESHARRLSRLVEDLLALATLDSERLLPAPRRLAVVPFLRACAGGLAPLAAKKKVVFSIKAGPGLSARVDRAYLRDVLQNLLDNAVKFSRAGGTVRVHCRARGGEVLLSVHNAGRVVPQRELPRVFERFYSKRRGVLGSGLGLSIAKSLVEASGGRVWMESSAARGTTVFLTLPRGR